MVLLFIALEFCSDIFYSSCAILCLNRNLYDHLVLPSHSDSLISLAVYENLKIEEKTGEKIKSLSP